MFPGPSWRAAGRVRRRGRGPSSRRRGALLGVLALLGAAACARSAPPGVVLVVVDTLRHDALGIHGAGPDTTPALDAFAADAVRFERAYAAAPWTLASVASMLTGLHPSAHGVTSPRIPLADTADTLAEILAERGFATAAVVSLRALGAPQGFVQGFQAHHADEARGHDHVSTEGVTARAVAILRDFAEAEEPFFLFVHYFDPHYNYKRHAGIGFAPERGATIDGSEPVMALQERLEQLTPEDVALLRGLYLEEVRHTDAGIGRLLAALDRLGLARRSVVVVTADHGEEFMERGWVGHIRSLYDELTRVPLLIRAPGARTRAVKAPVSLVSLTPTILELVGIDPAGFGFQAPSLAAVVRGDAEPYPDPILTEVDFVPVWVPERRTHKSALISGRYKLIRDEASGRIELYDLVADPPERADLAAARPELARRLAAQLDDRQRRFARRRLRAVPRQLSPEEIEQLQALGYAGEAPGRSGGDSP